ncbi:MAG TPA: hypothetical protein VNQ76_14490 [Planctomicrobium sp.]|nr:hypothetical protein [Planctomicrobium sp.]
MNAKTTATAELNASRRMKDRRFSTDRRQRLDDKVEVEQRRVSERRKVERRRQIDPTTCERDYKPDEVEFMRAMDDYKRRSGRQFPTWSEVLEVIRDLGYRKVAAPSTTFENLSR